MTWDDADKLGALAIFLLVIIAIWKETADFSRTEEEEEEIVEPENEVENEDLFAGKRECLIHAIAIRNDGDTPERIISVAQKFWDFLRKADPDNDQED